jgi:hypothetical protein
MQTQVRVYRTQAGRLEAFVREWREHVVPLRRRFGFEVVGAWASEEDDTFVWVLAHEGDFAEADRAYYHSPERAALDPDPARLIAETRTFRARPTPLP